MKTKKILFILLAATASFSIAQPAMAATATSNLAVSATISTVCSLGTTALAFGEVNISGATTAITNGTGTITVTCTSGGGYTLALNAGLHAVGAQRNLKSGTTKTLAYLLYSDAGRATVWNPATAPIAGTGTAALQTVTVYGGIAAGLPIIANDTDRPPSSGPA